MRSPAEPWQEHIDGEFRDRSTEATLHTMVDDAYVNRVPGVDPLHERQRLS
jgi:hypothetical protein